MEPMAAKDLSATPRFLFSLLALCVGLFVATFAVPAHAQAVAPDNCAEPAQVADDGDDADMVTDEDSVAVGCGSEVLRTHTREASESADQPLLTLDAGNDGSVDHYLVKVDCGMMTEMAACEGRTGVQYASVSEELYMRLRGVTEDPTTHLTEEEMNSLMSTLADIEPLGEIVVGLNNLVNDPATIMVPATTETQEVDGGVAVGAGAKVKANGGVALGNGATVGADIETMVTLTMDETGLLVVGTETTTTGGGGDNGIAIGNGAKAMGDGSIAIGSGATAMEDGQVMIGTHDIGAMADDVMENAAGVMENAAGVMENAAGVMENAAGVARNAEGVATNAAGIARNGMRLDNHDEALSDHNERLMAHGQRIDENRGMINDNRGMIDQNGMRLDNHGMRLDNHDARLGDHNERLMAHGMRIDENRGMINTNSTKIENNAGRINENRGMINDNRGMIATNAGRINENRGMINDNRGMIGVNAGRINENRGMINTNAQMLNTHSNMITNAMGRLDGHDTALTAHENRLNQHSTMLAGHAEGINNNAMQIDMLDERVSQVAAMSAALSAVPNAPDMDEKFFFGVGVGSHGGESGFAAGLAGRVGANKNIVVNAGLANSSGGTTVRAGVGWSF